MPSRTYGDPSMGKLISELVGVAGLFLVTSGLDGAKTFDADRTSDDDSGDGCPLAVDDDDEGEERMDELELATLGIHMNSWLDKVVSADMVAMDGWRRMMLMLSYFDFE